MPNERIRAAIQAAGLTVEDLATRTGVDPKTAERWITVDGRTPHRGTRKKITEALGVNELQLWPSLAGDLHTRPSETAELVHLYPSRTAVPSALWTELITGVQEQMDVLVFSGQFLVDQYNIIQVVREKAAEGVRFRFAVGDETSDAVTQRAIEEGTSGGLQGRIQLMRRYMNEVSNLPGVEVRTHGTILYNSLYRFDDQLFINCHAFGALAGHSPVIHIRQLPDGLMWQRYLASFEQAWEQATPDLTGRV